MNYDWFTSSDIVLCFSACQADKVSQSNRPSHKRWVLKSKKEMMLLYSNKQGIQQTFEQQVDKNLTLVPRWSILHIYCSNLLIIHQVTTTKITAVKEVWIPSLDEHRFWRFYFSIYSLDFVSIEKVNQTLKTVFHLLSKHLEFRQKYFAACHVFNSLLSVWISRRNTVSGVWYIISPFSFSLGRSSSSVSNLNGSSATGCESNSYFFQLLFIIVYENNFVFLFHSCLNN